MYENQGYRGEIKIRDLERTSDRPFGRVSNKGRFQFNIEKVPFYNIPDLTGFKVSLPAADLSSSRLTCRTSLRRSTMLIASRERSTLTRSCLKTSSTRLRMLQRGVLSLRTR
ncbi:MAG: hypothetical protein ACK56F_07425, partial [bacterium]